MKKLLSVIILAALFFGFPAIVGLASSTFAAEKKRPLEVVSAPVVKPQAGKTGWLAEGGLGGGAIVVEAVYNKRLRDNLSLSGGVGYALGNGFGVVVFDPIRATFEIRGFSVGLGVNYASYSTIVSNVPGLAKTISDKNLPGVEIFTGRQFGRYLGRLGYSTALGLRAAVGYEI